MTMSPSEFLTRELRRRRVAAGLSQEALGELMHFSGSHVSSVETGQRPPTPKFLKVADEVLNTGGLLMRLHEDLVKADESPVWAKEWLFYEELAEALRTFENTTIPGLLQTEAYARAIFESGGLLTPGEVERRVAARLERQAVLRRENPPQFTVVLDAGVLRRPVGGPEVMREQLLHLVDIAKEMPHVRMQVVPESVGAYSGLGGAFIIATLPDNEDVAYLDHQAPGQVVVGGPVLAWILKAWEAIRSEALPHQQSIERISEAAEKWAT
ncbi:helix-turn-helix transcriptional regulator [Plantactinospora sp. KLBMP9567]|uniref:helix-turn-helix domain-containing protein n=1 Tax=Plantactinospora sp. KLBMP9567 TaxID=3085900 RepID=UPI002980FDAB|nr:helix-turn-helix transcriptional regulator [Plantactinospora sp. KLBMP9567]MDW5322728.1 helix-turn-helix transcriptional regulator [Plantactinospora sp. KLBMP9567]